MIRLVIYDGTETYMYPNGALATPEVVKRDYPAVDVFPHVIEVNGNVLQAIQELTAMRNLHGIDESLSNEEAVLAMQTIINTPQEVVDEPTPEERIASAMEFQNLLAL